MIYNSAPLKKSSKPSNQEVDYTAGVDSSINNCYEECDRVTGIDDCDSEATSVISGKTSSTRDRDISEDSSESVVVLDRNGSLEDRSPTMTISPTPESTEDTVRSVVSFFFICGWDGGGA